MPTDCCDYCGARFPAWVCDTCSLLICDRHHGCPECGSEELRRRQSLDADRRPKVLPVPPELP